MKIGTVRPEEARIHDSMAGEHQFHHEETQEPYGSFEIFWQKEDPAGWYWRGCGAQRGPFASSRQAHEDADPWSHEYDE